MEGDNNIGEKSPETGAAAAQVVETPQPITLETFDDSAFIGELNRRAGINATSFQDLAPKQHEYKSPLAAKIDEMIGGGVAETEVVQYLKIAVGVDTAKLSDFDALVMAKSLEHNISEEDAIALLAEEGVEKDLAEGQVESVKRKIEARKAREVIESKKVALANPQSLAQAQAERRQQEEKVALIADEWPKVVSKVAQPEIKIKSVVAEGLEYEFVYNPAADIVAKAAKDVEAFLVNSRIDVTEQNKSRVTDMVTARVKELTQEDFMSKLIKDVHDSTVEQMAKKFAGTPPKAATTKTPETAPAKRRESLLG